MSTHKIGEEIPIKLPYSEVCMHLGIAGEVWWVKINPGSAQILDREGKPYSIPITWGEAGIFTGRAGQPYTIDPA